MRSIGKNGRRDGKLDSTVSDPKTGSRTANAERLTRRRSLKSPSILVGIGLNARNASNSVFVCFTRVLRHNAIGIYLNTVVGCEFLNDAYVGFQQPSCRQQEPPLAVLPFVQQKAGS